MRSPLSPEQEKDFASLYQEGWSARYIFNILGQPYSRIEDQNASSRMRHYAKKLGLPMRGVGFRAKNLPFDGRLEDPEWRKVTDAKRKQLRKERIDRLPVMIKRAETQIVVWKAELKRLKQEFKEKYG